MHKRALPWASLLLFNLFCFNPAFANDSFSGTVRLPNGNATIENSFEVELVSYDLLREVRDRQTKTIFIQEGDSAANFTFAAIDRQKPTISGYSVAFFCRVCEQEVPFQQFWTIAGTKFLSSDAIITSRQVFPLSIDHTLVRGTSVSGRVELANGKLAERELNIILRAAEGGPPSIDTPTSGGSVGVTIPKGSNSTSFSIEGIRPDGPALQLAYICENCLTDHRTFGESLEFLSPRQSHSNKTLTLLSSGLAISGTVTVPKSLITESTQRIVLSFKLEDFDNFFSPITTLNQTLSVEKVPSRIKFGILVPNNKWENLEIKYECLTADDKPCTGVLPTAFYDNRSQPFNVNQTRARGIFIDAFEVEFFGTNENLNFCVIPDQDLNGIPDSSKAACSVYNPAPIFLLLND